MPNAKRKLDKLVQEQRARSAPLTLPQQIDGLNRHFIHGLHPALFCREALKFEPDPWQKRLLDSPSRKIIVNVARQQGKSTTAAAKAVHRAVFFPKSVILVVAPTVPQAGELRRKIDDHLRCLRDVFVKPVADNKRELEFENGSRIVVLAADEDTVRAYTAHMIIEDESATVPDALYEAMEPMLLVTGGQHILLGTPKGLRGHFSDLWHEGSAAWDRYEVTAWTNPRVPKATLDALKEEKERLGRGWWFAQEYECSFIAAAQGLVYPYDHQKNSSPRLPLHPSMGWQFVLGIDYGYVDSTAFVVLGWQANDPHLYVVESFDKRGLLAAEAAEIALGLTKKYPFARMVGDTSGFGKGYVEEARRRLRLPIEPAQKNNKRGYIELMTGDLKVGLLKLFPGNDELIKEWRQLPWDEQRNEPMDGHKDHLSDACLYAWRAAYNYLEEIRTQGPKPGTREAWQLEAQQMFDDRVEKLQRQDREWWDQGDVKWDEPTLN